MTIDAVVNKIQLSYAVRYADVGDNVVLLMWGLAFAIYLILARFSDVRRLLSQYLIWLLTLSTIGNAAVCVLILRFYENELLLINSLLPINNDVLIEAVKSGFELRIALIGANFLLYLVVLMLVARFHAVAISKNSGGDE